MRLAARLSQRSNGTSTIRRYREGRNIERCARNVDGDPTVRLPRVYWDRTTARVLTLEFLDGMKLADLDLAGVDPDTRRVIARAGVQEDVNVRMLERDLAALIETHANVPIKDLSAREVLSDVVRTAARHRLRIPTNLMLLIKALVTIEGVGLQLDPSFKIVDTRRRSRSECGNSRYGPDALGRRAWRGVEHSLSAARRLPVQLDAIARKIRDGRLEIRFVLRNLDHFVKEMDRSSNCLAFALIIASLVVGSSLIIQTGRGSIAYGYPVLGLAGFVVAVCSASAWRSAFCDREGSCRLRFSAAS